MFIPVSSFIFHERLLHCLSVANILVLPDQFWKRDFYSSNHRRLWQSHFVHISWKSRKLIYPPRRITDEKIVNDLTNDVNTITDNKNMEGNVDCGQNANKQTSMKADFLNTWYPPNADVKFPKRITGNRQRYFQHQRFDEFK